MAKITASTVIRALVTAFASAIRVDPIAAEFMMLSMYHLYRGVHLQARSRARQIGHAAGLLQQFVTRPAGAHFDDGRSTTR
jgi:hypothetical protein